MLCLLKQRDVVCVGIPGSRSRKFPASMAFPSPVSIGHVGANTPGRRKTSCRCGESKHSVFYHSSLDALLQA